MDPRTTGLRSEIFEILSNWNWTFDSPFGPGIPFRMRIIWSSLKQKNIKMVFTQIFIWNRKMMIGDLVLENTFYYFQLQNLKIIFTGVFRDFSNFLTWKHFGMGNMFPTSHCIKIKMKIEIRNTIKVNWKSLTLLNLNLFHLRCFKYLETTFIELEGHWLF